MEQWSEQDERHVPCSREVAVERSGSCRKTIQRQRHQLLRRLQKRPPDRRHRRTCRPAYPSAAHAVRVGALLRIDEFTDRPPSSAPLSLRLTFEVNSVVKSHRRNKR
jgi:hypothetical protein